MLQQIIIILCCAYTVLSMEILFIHINDKKRYCSVGMNIFYFLIIYHCSLLLSSHLILFLYFFFIPTLLNVKVHYN